MKIHHLLFALVLLSSSCKWGTPNKQKPAITTDTLAYTYQTIKQRAADCGNKPDSGCTVVNIKYPVFAKDDLLNDTLRHKLLNLFQFEGKDTSLNQLATSFLKMYKDDIQPKNNSGVVYRLNIKADVVRQDSSIIIIQILGDTYSGGAHGGTTTQFINWNTKADRKIALDDILTNGNEDKLTKIADSIFRKNEKLSNTASLVPNYFFKNGKFGLNNNFMITPLALRFLYNEYEIKPYSAGQTEILIPYAQIKSLLKQNTVITQYLK